MTQIYTDKKDPQTYSIIGAAMAVHKELGDGLLEAVYQDALSVEFVSAIIPFQREFPVPISYKGTTLGAAYRADFVCYDSIIVELKALKCLSGIEEAQLIHYLKATGMRKGLLINFGSRRLEYKRFVL